MNDIDSPRTDEALAEADRLLAGARFAEALAAVDSELDGNPANRDMLLCRARILFSWRRCREAYHVGLSAAGAGLQSTALFLNLGWSSFALGNLAESESWMRKAIASKPIAWEPHFNLGVVLQARKQTAEAMGSYRRALAINGGEFECLLGLGRCQFDMKLHADAESSFRTAAGLRVENAAALEHLGTAIGRQGRFGDALIAIKHAHELDLEARDKSDVFVSLAIALSDSGRNREALALYERSLPDQPSEGGYYAYSHLLLKLGRLREGWHFHEFRWLIEPQLSLRLNVGLPMWNGQNVEGKTILLHVEQGFGDIIQLIRYAPALKAAGATLVLRVAKEMAALASGFQGIDRIVTRDEPVPAFNYYIHLFGLPRVFNTELETIPAEVPYLHADAERIAKWAPRLPTGSGLKVGLVWAGNPQHSNDRNRSIRLEALQPLLGIAGVQFVSLQKGTPAEEIHTLPPGVVVTDVGAELQDFSDTAAVVEQLDLVLCVDTAVAHLAGALGKPVWVMLPTPADWRWLEGREDSPWYPTMRLFRQRQRGQWQDVIDDVKTALEALSHAGKVKVTPAKTHAAMPRLPAPTLPHAAPGHRAGFSAAAECRDGILQYLPDEPYEGDSIGWYGEYLQPQLDLLRRIIQPGATVMEVGAGVGAHALALAVAVGDAGHLFLYESRPVMHRILRQNLGANRIGNVTLMRRALGRPHDQSTDAGPPTSETLDDLRLERLDWLKVNASVAPLEVLEGASDTLWRLRPMLLLAAGDDVQLAALAERVREYSYRCWRMEVPLFNPQNFNRREDDIFAGHRAVALVAIPEEIDVDMALDHCVEIASRHGYKNTASSTGPSRDSRMDRKIVVLAKRA